MYVRFSIAAALAAASGLVAGCASDGGIMTTSAISEKPAAVAAAPKVDPICVSMAAQLDQLRQEGSVGRLEQAATGKTATVQVKRASLSKQAEFNKVSAEYQAKCSPIAPKVVTAPAAAPVTAAPAAAKPAKKAAVPKKVNKTVAAAAPAATAVAAPSPAVTNVVKTVAKPQLPVAAAPVVPALPSTGAAPVVVTTMPPAAAPQQ